MALPLFQISDPIFAAVRILNADAGQSGGKALEKLKLSSVHA
jgi:hypothetical protein